MKKLIVYIDGASKGNPGKASIGIVIRPDNKTAVIKKGMSIGIATNNIAEYMALITALVDCLQYNPEYIEIKSDSQLLVRQMRGEYRVKETFLQKLHFIASRLASRYNKITYTHIPREENTQADAEANKHIDEPGQLF